MALRREPISRLVAAKAATQGIYSTVNVRKAKADAGENIAPSAAESCASVVLPVKIVSVLTTVSFAERPVISAVDARQSVKPRGEKMGEITEPIVARILFDVSSVRFSFVSKFCKNQITIDARKIIVNAFFK